MNYLSERVLSQTEDSAVALFFTKSFNTAITKF